MVVYVGPSGSYRGLNSLGDVEAPGWLEKVAGYEVSGDGWFSLTL